MRSTRRKPHIKPGLRSFAWSMADTAAGVSQLDLTKRLVQRLFEFKQPPPPRGPHHEARSSPRLAHVALRHAGGPHSTSGRPPAPNACTRPQNPQHGGRASVGGVRVRSRTHRAAAALRARSAHVPPPQQREGIGPTPTHRRNHTPARPQHVHTGRREGREATGGYAHRCEVVAPLALASGPARTCRAHTALV